MIDTFAFMDGLTQADIRFVSGVPDSLLKDICARITDTFTPEQHIIATNEGSAVALAIGHYLSTARPALVYMQNSGLGNIVNPIASLADPQVYAVPMVLMIGWRGELTDENMQLHDEPQHIKQGQITLSLLTTLGIPFVVLDAQTTSIGSILEKAARDAVLRSGPVAIVVRKNTFEHYGLNIDQKEQFELSREEVIKEIVSTLPLTATIVCTTGMASRELYELRKSLDSGHQRDFLTVGGMGHASQIAAGIAISKPEKIVVCLDGDGAALMHAGALAISADCKNLIHILLNNEAHDSVGGQPTKGNILQFDRIAKAFGYKNTKSVQDRNGLIQTLESIFKIEGSRFLEVRCKRGARKNLGRPDRTPLQNKIDFMQFLGK